MSERERLLRGFIGLKVNKVWPYAAVLILRGWRDGRSHWKECNRAR